MGLEICLIKPVFGTAALKETSNTMKFEWFVALRYLLSRRKQSFITIISIISIAGVGLGVATVILVIAVLNGVEHGLKDRFLANEAHVILRVFGNNFFGDYENRIKRIKAIEDVVAASPVVYTQIGIFQKDSKGIDDVIYIKGIEPTQEDEVTGFSQFVSGSVDFKGSPLIEEARFLKDITVTGGIVVGSRLAARLGITEGDVLRLVVELVEIREGEFHPRIKNFVVIGVYESELAVYDNRFGFIHIDAAQKIQKQVGKVNVISVRLSDAELATEIGPLIEDAADFSVLEGVPLTTTWMETHGPLFTALELEKIATVIIEALIILVAAFNIASTLIMVVMEKTRDVGTLRTLGASRGDIMRIFMIQGSVIGMLGTISGTALGLGVCWLLSTNVMRPSPWFAFAVVGVLILCQLFITFRRIVPLPKRGKLGLVIFWLLAIGFGLYCLVEPISLRELKLSEIYQMNQLPIKVSWFFVIFINALSLVLCWLATLYPAWQASNLKPIEALQYE